MLLLAYATYYSKIVFPIKEKLINEVFYLHHLFIINRFAGKKDNYDFVVNQIKNIGIENYTILETSHQGDANVKARDFVKKSQEFVRIYACGGDGTFNEIINGVYNLDNCAVGVVPIGSGNDFIRSLSAESDKFMDIKNLINGNIEKVDLISCNGKIGANTVSLGYDCAIAKNMPKFRRWKFISSEAAYILSILYCIFKERKHKFKILTDNKEIVRNSKTYLLSIAAKGKYYGGGIKCSPKADNNDGKLDFLCVDTVSVFTILQLLTTFMKGEHLDNPKFDKILQHSKHNKIEYISDTPFDIGVDGEIISTSHAVVTVIPNGLNIIIPK